MSIGKMSSPPRIASTEGSTLATYEGIGSFIERALDLEGLTRSMSDPLNMNWRSAPACPADVPDKPSTDMLMAMHMPEANGSGRQALAVEVEDLLGYTPLRRDAKAPSRLQRLLAELDITAFDHATVASYKSRMRLHFQALADQEIRSANPGLDGEPFLRGGYIGRSVSWSMVPLERYEKPVPEHVLRKCVQIKRAAPDAKFFVDELREEQRTIDPFMWVTFADLNPAEMHPPLEEMAAIEVWDEPEFEKSL